MISDQLFAAEPFEQFPGQLSMAQLDAPIRWTVTVRLHRLDDFLPSGERRPDARRGAKPPETIQGTLTARSAAEAFRKAEERTWVEYGEVLLVEAER
jgi:hypothetical protein